MLIHLRGTNGAGKSTIVRSVMVSYPFRESVFLPGRRKPIGYVCSDDPTTVGCRKKLFVPGHYEIANGGLDTINSLFLGCEMILEYHRKGYHVLYEGRNSQDRTLVSEMSYLLGSDEKKVVFIHLDHPVEDCITSVRQRGHKIAEKTIRALSSRILRHSSELVQEGYDCRLRTRSSAFADIINLLHTQ